MIFNNKTLLVTGGTGSFGKVFIRRILSDERGQPKKIIVFSRDEAKQHDMRLYYMKLNGYLCKKFKELVEFQIGDVRNYADICSAVSRADVIVNAAALKQVPSCEYFPLQAIQTNCLGPSNIVRAIEENHYPVETVLGISTDKACKPVNVMGMTKALQERIFISANLKSPTRFICVRYGNVLASRASVIPFFHEQIRSGGPVTVTHESMTRFLISLDQAVDIVLEAIKYGNRGETFIPIAPAANVLDIAKVLVGDKKIEIKVTGIRPGEKLHEILVSEEEVLRTYKRDNYYVILPVVPEGCNLPSGPWLKKEYSSDDRVFNIDELRHFLENKDLLKTEQQFQEGVELLK